MNKILISVILALVILGSSFFLRQSKKISTMDRLVSTYREDRVVQETILKNFILLQSFIAGKSIKELVFLNPESDTIAFESVGSKGNKLFFRFTNANCSLCVEEEFKNLRKFIPHGYEKEVILLTSYNARVIKILIKSNELNFPFLTLPANNSDFLSGSLLPFYFICNKDGVIINSFVPNKDKPELTRLFIDDYITGVGSGM